MELQIVMEELRALGTERTKKTYLRHGAREPLFGVTTGAMKPLARRLGRDHALSMALYATGNYDAAYLAGMIADPAVMTQADFERWMETAGSSASPPAGPATAGCWAPGRMGSSTGRS